MAELQLALQMLSVLAALYPQIAADAKMIVQLIENAINKTHATPEQLEAAMAFCVDAYEKLHADITEKTNQ